MTTTQHEELARTEEMPAMTMAQMVTGVPETITVYKVEYRVQKTEQGYFLHGKRGAVYMLMRNYHKPHLLFPVSARNHLPHNLKGVRFTDEGGTLRMR